MCPIYKNWPTIEHFFLTIHREEHPKIGIILNFLYFYEIYYNFLEIYEIYYKVFLVK